MGRSHAKPLVYAYVVVIVAGVALWGTPAAANPQQNSAVPCVACQAIVVDPAAVPATPTRLNGTRVLLRIAPAASQADWSGTYASLQGRGARPGLYLTAIPAPDDAALAAPGETLVIEIGDAEGARQMFDLERALTTARGLVSTRKLLIAADARTEAALRASGLDPYVDGYIHPPDRIDRPEDLLIDWPPEEVFRVRTLPLAPQDAATVLADAAALQTWFPAGLIDAPGRRLLCGAERLRTLLNPQTLDLVAVSRSCPTGAPVTGDIPGVVADRLEVGAIQAFRLSANAASGVASQVEVAGRRSLSVAEIIARHQAAAARQAHDIRTDIASGTQTLTFDAPGFAAPVTVAARTTLYTDERGTDLREQDIRVNGVAFRANGSAPRLPIIEPERAASPPLAITLTDVYRYRLDGYGTLDGRRCAVVTFTPRDPSMLLFSGRAWIDAATFGLVRVSAVETGLRGPITASEQTDEYRQDSVGRWLLARSDVRQTYDGAGFRTPIHRLLILDRHDINAADFGARVQAAYASDDVMLRDTPDGYRYIVRRTEPAGSSAPSQIRTATRAVTAVRTLVGGVIVDPNISVPLPFAGLSYVNFNVLGTGTQFSGFFGGSYGQLAFSTASLGRSHWRAGGRAFAIATSYNDRAFIEGREQYDRDLRQRPADAAVWLLGRLSPRVDIRLEYDWDYTHLAAGDQTLPAFVVPANQVAHGVRAALEWQRAGWQASVWWNPSRRIGWRAWGVPGESEYRASQTDFQRYGATVLRSIALTRRVSTHVEIAAMAGHDLDRFSRYTFGTFDNRLHGYPSALIRYDRGAVLRTALAWSAAKAVRLDGFFDTARVHDPSFGRALRQYTGTGAAVEVPAPFGTLAAIEWGYGFEGIATDGHVGTSVVRITVYKVF